MSYGVVVIANEIEVLLVDPMVEFNDGNVEANVGFSQTNLVINKDNDNETVQNREQRWQMFLYLIE